MPSNILPLQLKQTFPPIIWIFTEDEGDGIESRLPFKIFSTLPDVIVFQLIQCFGVSTKVSTEGSILDSYVVYNNV